MNSEYGSEQRNNALDMLKQRQRASQGPPALAEQQPNILYTMPMQMVERLERVLRDTLALQENIRAGMEALVTKEDMATMATSEELLSWLNRVQELNQETYASMGQVLRAMKEEEKQAGNKRDKCTSTLSDMERQFRADGKELLRSFRRWAAITILSSAAGAVVASILIWLVLG